MPFTASHIAGTKYPPTLVTTSDHDDRVSPSKFQYAAALQAAQAGEAPILIRRDKGRHGAGKPTTKQIEEQTDIWFIKSLGMPSNNLEKA